MVRRFYVLLRRSHDAPFRRRGDVPQRHLCDVPPRRRWVFHLRHSFNVVGTNKTTSSRHRSDVLLPGGKAVATTLWKYQIFVLNLHVLTKVFPGFGGSESLPVGLLKFLQEVDNLFNDFDYIVAKIMLNCFHNVNVSTPLMSCFRLYLNRYYRDKLDFAFNIKGSKLRVLCVFMSYVSCVHSCVTCILALPVLAPYMPCVIHLFYASYLPGLLACLRYSRCPSTLVHIE